ncbi:MAG: NADH-quinone oxidoreductase subunit N [Phycisphaeraceae bacterium]
MSIMLEKLIFLWPEIIMLCGAVTVMLVGLSASAAVRRSCTAITAGALVLAGVAVIITSDPAFIAQEKLDTQPNIAVYIKLAVVGIGVLLLMVAGTVTDKLAATRDSEGDAGKPFDPATSIRGEFFAFFLFSLTGVMLCAGAGDLAWLFLALELVSLPTYVMIAVTRDRLIAQESAVKYFFLGALAVAIFLYGFALIYGATGFTDFASIKAYLASEIAAGNGLSPLFITGLVLAIVGIAFKIAAAPMQFYAADVYEGAATPVTAFLAFVPKTAGFIALMLLIDLVPGKLPEPVVVLLWVMAAVTMTYGNVMGLLQTSVKRMLAYSSIAHSGYMLVGLLAGSTLTTAALKNGHAGVLFYLVAYGLGNLAAFAVLSSLEAKGEEAETFDDLSGLSRRNPILAAIMLLSMLSLVGLPPLVGFLGKIYLFGPAVNDYTWLVVIAVLNSAISAVYYLRVVSVCYFSEPAPDTTVADNPPRRTAAMIAALASLVIGVTGGWLVDAAKEATGQPVAKVKPAKTVEGGATAVKP